MEVAAVAPQCMRWGVFACLHTVPHHIKVHRVIQANRIHMRLPHMEVTCRLDKNLILRLSAASATITCSLQYKPATST